MNEIEMLTRLRNEVPAGEVSASAARRFYTAISAERSVATPSDPFRRTGTPRPAYWLRRPAHPRLAAGLAAGVAAVVAADAATAVIGVGAHSSANRPMAGSHPATSAPLTARELAYRASAAVLTQPAVSPGQWVYAKMESSGPGMKDEIREYWQTADDLRSAYYWGGRLIVGNNTPPPDNIISYSELNALPRDPMALIQYIYRSEARVGIAPGLGTEIAFQELGQLALEYVLPPRLTAEVYQALADIPGVTVNKDAVTITGVHGIAFVLLRRSDHLNEEVILSNSSFDEIATAVIAKGWVKESAILQQASVAGPGVRPRNRERGARRAGRHQPAAF
jgi:hypothetical protein